VLGPQARTTNTSQARQAKGETQLSVPLSLSSPFPPHPGGQLSFLWAPMARWMYLYASTYLLNRNKLLTHLFPYLILSSKRSRAVFFFQSLSWEHSWPLINVWWVNDASGSPPILQPGRNQPLPLVTPHSKLLLQSLQFSCFCLFYSLPSLDWAGNWEDMEIWAPSSHPCTLSELLLGVFWSFLLQTFKPNVVVLRHFRRAYLPDLSLEAGCCHGLPRHHVLCQGPSSQWDSIHSSIAFIHFPPVNIYWALSCARWYSHFRNKSVDE
jgi:hypothetical protein